MACNIFLYSKIVKIDSNVKILVLICCPLAASEKFMGLLRYQCTVFIVFIFLIHYENKY